MIAIRRSGERAKRLFEEESGALVIIVMMFTLIFIAMGIALFYLVKMNTTSVDLERREAKSFNVAEAGVDAGMLTVMKDWPDEATDNPAIDYSQLRPNFDATEYPDPSRSPASDFVNVRIYDDLDPIDPNVTWDSNQNRRLIVDSEANVADARHRIMVQCEQQTWELNFPFIAMYADVASANGQGLRVRWDPADTEALPLMGPLGPTVGAFYNDTLGKGVNLPADGTVSSNPEGSTTFNKLIASSLISALAGIADAKGTYFTSAAQAEALLTGTSVRSSAEGGDAAGEIVFIKSSTTVEIAANTQMGTREKPVVLVVDVPDGTDVGMDFRGTADFYGIVVTTGNPIVRGTQSFWGSFIAKNDLDSNGVGSSPEINYNGAIINSINGLHTISVNIVPNTWEEYTLPKGSTTTVP